MRPSPYVFPMNIPARIRARPKPVVSASILGTRIPHCVRASEDKNQRRIDGNAESGTSTKHHAKRTDDSPMLPPATAGSCPRMNSAEVCPRTSTKIKVRTTLAIDQVEKRIRSSTDHRVVSSIRSCRESTAFGKKIITAASTLNETTSVTGINAARKQRSSGADTPSFRSSTVSPLSSNGTHDTGEVR